MDLPHWQPPHSGLSIRTLDCHTGGEALRIITHGFPTLAGKTMLEKRKDCLSRFDSLRTALMFEPRGHADMYGALITPPERSSSHFGVLFLHNEGYSTMCGHAIIALAKVAIESGWVVPECESTEIRIDTPAGLVRAYCATDESGQVLKTWFRNVPAFVQYLGKTLAVPSIGNISVDIAFGGAFYVFVDADLLQLELKPRNAQHIIALGREIKNACINQYPVQHPEQSELSFLYGTIFIGASPEQGVHSRHACVFAEGELDRSPTGTGVSARAAIEFAKQSLPLQTAITIDSILASPFNVSAIATTLIGQQAGIVTDIEGTAFITGTHTFYIDPKDPLKSGFIFR